MFDWVGFLTQNNIDHTSASRYHVTGNNVAICCPWCPHDTGYNLHISLQGRGFHCFLVDSHRGIAPQPLIQKLLRCPYAYADSLVQSVEIPSDNDILKRLEALFDPVIEPMPPRQALKLPDSFTRIEARGSGRMFVTYMARRGFEPEDVPFLSRRYHLRGCADGSRWHGRIIFPVTIDQKLVTWTGRHCGGSPIRYDTLSVYDPDSPALETIKNTILWYDALKQARGTLVVCEGPFDSLKINYLGEGFDVYATCLFGKSITDRQCELLESLENFDRKILLLDRNTVDHFNPRSNFGILESAGFTLTPLPRFVKDPGELNRETFATLFA
jgi:hypothetical protein